LPTVLSVHLCLPLGQNLGWIMAWGHEGHMLGTMDLQELGRGKWSEDWNWGCDWTSWNLHDTVLWYLSVLFHLL